tara:strand:+ start:7797 stop:8507 length:711 start_codon:yes stop_codon:yes gene_type:complete
MNIIKKIIKCISNPQYIKSYLHMVCPLFEVNEIFKIIKKNDVLIDIGSNKGQFSVLFNNYFPNSIIHSFEPQKSALEIQKKILNKNIIYYNYCLGKTNSSKVLNITKRNDSSSILTPMIYKESIYQIIKKKKVKVKRLDNILKLSNSKNIFMKLDVQGYEREVLLGAGNSLSKINYILIELSSAKIYGKQSNSNEIINFLKKNNFILKKELNKSFLKKNIYQTDCLFSNTKKNKDL